jgi:acyl carrier protein
MVSEREAKYWNEFRLVIAQKLDVAVERVDRQAIFIADLGADSLDIVDLLMDLEDRFNIVISEQSAAELRSVGAFFDFVYAKIGPDAA